MSGKFSELGKVGSGLKAALTPGVVRDESVASPARPQRLASQQQAEPSARPTKLVHARVDLQTRKQFLQALLDLQDHFVEEVTQEEAIGALLYLVTTYQDAREQWIDAIAELRARR